MPGRVLGSGMKGHRHGPGGEAVQSRNGGSKCGVEVRMKDALQDSS